MGNQLHHSLLHLLDEDESLAAGAEPPSTTGTTGAPDLVHERAGARAFLPGPTNLRADR